MVKKNIYRIIFHNNDKIYEIYSQSITDGELFGFIEAEELIFGEGTNLVVDPSEEFLKTKFNGVVKTYIPVHSVIRIDVVGKKGTAKIKDNPGEGSKVMHFPTPPKR